MFFNEKNRQGCLSEKLVKLFCYKLRFFCHTVDVRDMIVGKEMRDRCHAHNFDSDVSERRNTGSINYMYNKLTRF